MTKRLNVLLTGGNTGIGRSTAEALARGGHRVWLACRSEAKTSPVIDAIRKENPSAELAFLPLDLSDLRSVRACASAFVALGQPLDVLLANAGVAAVRGLSPQGFELMFATNHLGHFLLTELLLPSLAAAPTSRVVVVSSKAHYDAPGIDWEALRAPAKTVTGMAAYAVSKLCNVLFARELARRTRAEGMHVSTYSLHPGVVSSDIWRKVPWPIRPLMKLRMISNDEGAKTSLYCATSPDVAGRSGLYWDKCKEKTPSAPALDDALAKELWDKSEAWTRESGVGDPEGRSL
jgi:NAD(P)-dependent dehydrogenase (short-subunit alcohol dehydrogenase family)